MNSGIYKWSNKETGSVYIGQATDLDKRCREFLNFKQKYAGKLINDERKKYPSLTFWDYEILEKCDINDLTLLENKWIKTFSNYNLLNEYHKNDLFLEENKNNVFYESLNTQKRKVRVIHLEKDNQHYYFGSLINLFEYFTPKELGITYGSLKNYNIAYNKPFINKKCIIRRGILLSKNTERGKRKDNEEYSDSKIS